MLSREVTRLDDRYRTWSTHTLTSNAFVCPQENAAGGSMQDDASLSRLQLLARCPNDICMHPAQETSAYTASEHETANVGFGA